MNTPTLPASGLDLLTPNVRQFPSGPKQMLIDGEWIDAASGKTFSSSIPPPAKPSPRWPKAKPRTSITRSPPPGILLTREAWRNLTPTERGKDPVARWRPDSRSSRRVRAARVAGQRKTRRRGPRGGRSAGRGSVPLHGGLGDEDRGKHHPHQRAVCARRKILRLHPPRSRRRGGPDHSLEFSAPDGRVETRSRAGHRKFRGAETRRTERRSLRCSSGNSSCKPACPKAW
jgi:hypothetical protein